MSKNRKHTEPQTGSEKILTVGNGLESCTGENSSTNGVGETVSMKNDLVLDLTQKSTQNGSRSKFTS